MFKKKHSKEVRGGIRNVKDLKFSLEQYASEVALASTGYSETHFFRLFCAHQFLEFFCFAVYVSLKAVPFPASF